MRTPTSARNGHRTPRYSRKRDVRIQAPLVWTFDGPFTLCLQDMEDTFRRAIIQVGDVSRILVQIDLSLAALKPRVDAGEAIQPAWGEFVDRLSHGYGLPVAPRVRHLAARGPLATMVIAYRS